MVLLPVLLLLGASSRVELLDQVYSIASGERHSIEFNLTQLPVAIACEFEIISGQGDVRIAMLRWREPESRRRARSREMVAATDPGRRGSLRYHVPAPGEYVIWIQNRGRASGDAQVHVKAALEFPQITYLSRARRLAVILISFTMFFAVVTYSARKLLRGLRK